MDQELLSMVPRPVCAILLLFPVTEKVNVTDLCIVNFHDLKKTLPLCVGNELTKEISGAICEVEVLRKEHWYTPVIVQVRGLFSS